MKTNRITHSILIIVAALFTSFSFAQQKDYKKELDILFKAFQTQDYQIMKPLLDDKVLLSVKIPVGMNDMIIPQVLTQLPVPESYEVIKTEQVMGNPRITTEYTYKDRNKRLQYFTFNAAGKVVNLDILSDAKKIDASYNGSGTK